MRAHLLTGAGLLILSAGLLQASEPKTGTLIQFGALGGWVIFSSIKVIRSFFKQKK